MGRRKLESDFRPEFLDDYGLDLEVRWSVSKARDTYGYNICTLYANGDTPVARCNGGGYDMVGTVFGQWLTHAFQEDLHQLAYRADAWDFWDEDNQDWHGSLPLMWTDDFKVLTRAGVAGNLYGLRTVFDMDFNIVKMSIDGACGENSVMNVFNALGWSKRWVKSGRGRYKDDQHYRIERDESKLIPFDLDKDPRELMVAHDPEAHSVLSVKEYHLGTHTWREYKTWGRFVDLFLSVPDKMGELLADGWGNTESTWVDYKGAIWRTDIDHWEVKPHYEEWSKRCGSGISWNRKKAPVLVATLREDTDE